MRLGASRWGAPRLSLANRLALVFFAITLLAIGSLYVYVAPGLQSRLMGEKLAELAHAAVAPDRDPHGWNLRRPDHTAVGEHGPGRPAAVGAGRFEQSGRRRLAHLPGRSRHAPH